MEAALTFQIVAWLIGLIWCLRNAKLLAAAFATMGAFAAFVPNLPEWIHTTAILLFVISLWLEAMMRDRIYSRYLSGESQRRTREP